MINIDQSEHIAIGDSCQLLLRPQHILLSKSSDGPAKVIEQQFMGGDHCRYAIEVEALKY